MLNAARTGSSSYRVPGTRAPPGMPAPGTTGPSNFVQAGNPSASIAQPRESMRQRRAVSIASLPSGASNASA